MNDLTYVLSTFPVARETFVTGEIAAVADLVDHVRVLALTRTDEPNVRPGGIPELVEVDWFPRLREAAWVRGLARTLVARPMDVADAALQQVRAPGVGRLGDLYRASRTAAAAGRWRGADAATHLHAHFGTRGAMAAWMLGRLLGRPYSVTVHAYDLYMDNPFLRPVVQHAALVVAISEDGREELVRLVPDVAERVRVIHVGVPTEELRAGGRSGPIPGTPGAGPVRLVSAGRLVEKKGFRSLIEAVAIGRAGGLDVTLDIVGDGPLRADLGAAIAERRLGGVVTLVGHVSPDQARARIGAADVLVLACIEASDGDRDGIPVVLMEAMAMGVPVVSTRVSGVPELIEPPRTGRLAPAGDAEAIVAQIRATIEMPPGQRAEQVAAARRVVEAGFDQRRNAERLVAAIRELPEAQPRTSSTIRRR